MKEDHLQSEAEFDIVALTESNLQTDEMGSELFPTESVDVYRKDRKCDVNNEQSSDMTGQLNFYVAVIYIPSTITNDVFEHFTKKLGQTMCHKSGSVIQADIMTPRTLEGSIPESEATDINEADVEHDDDDNISTEQSPPTTPTTSQTLLPQIHQSPQSSSSSSKRLFKSPPKKKNRRQNEAAKYDEAFLRIEQEKLKYFKGPVQDSEMLFLMSLHPFLKKIPASQQLSVRADLMQVLMKNQPSPSYLPTPSPGYQSSSEDWLSDCSSAQSSTSYVILEGTRQLATQHNPPQLQTFFTSFDPTDIEKRS
ncbi:unnamed protein product [Acanthoscelides obtectus]|uniref:BESS domain-containing protein n=1 Tax=Acanthoscelides obtectus TaxID=200917 RepID=A0A9P0M0Z7_ACAOB|nr:unnamed protein product [Acanthoscelides obtectus]CAK1642282.1 hypothetical protein AOBTE_LOCUS12950 [Acanthoscelides obtectus]